MIVIFDLDYTLLDTEKFKKDIVKIFDISVKKFNENYDRLFTDKKIGYSPYKHIRLLKKEKKSILVSDCDKRMSNLVKKTNKYLFPSAKEVIKIFKKRGDKLILMSIGDKEWQKKKINNIKIKKYFDKVIIIEKEKYKNLEFLKKEKEKILIINDNARETLDMKKAIGKCEVCLIRGPYSKNAKHKFNIYDIKDCIKLYE